MQQQRFFLELLADEENNTPFVQNTTAAAGVKAALTCAGCKMVRADTCGVCLIPVVSQVLYWFPVDGTRHKESCCLGRSSSVLRQHCSSGWVQNFP